MRGAEALSTYAPIAEREKFRIEYWALEEAKLQRLPDAEAPRRPHRPRHRRGQRHRQGHRRPSSPPTAPASSSPTSTLDKAAAAAAELGDRRRRRRRRGRRHRRRPPCAPPSTPRCSPSAGSTSSSTTPACRSPSRCSTPPRQDWDLQHDVMAKGSFLVAQAAARAMIDQRLGGDIVYIASKNARVRRPEQRRLQRDQGRPGPPGPAARRRARRARHPGQRRQPRRRRAGQRHLRRRLGRRSAPRSTACPRRSSAPSTPSARCSSARCCPSTSPTPSPPSARTSSATPPACSSPSTPASPPPSSADADAGLRRRRHRRVGRPGRWPASSSTATASRSTSSTASPTASPSATATCAGTSTALRREVRDRPGPASPTRSRSASTPGASTTACSTPTAALLAEPIAYRDDRTATVIDDGPRRRAARRAVRRQRAAVPAVQHDLPARRRAARPAVGPRRARRAAPRPARLLAHRRAAHRADQRVDHRAARRPHPAVVDRAARPARPPRGAAARRSSAPGDGARARPRRHPGRHGRLARHRLGRRRRAGHDRPLRLHRQRHVVARRPRARRPRSSPTAARAANFTNEVGVDGRTRFLRNVGGLWLLQECLRDVAARRPRRPPRRGRPRCRPAGRPSTSTTRRSSRPGGMPERIAAAAGRPTSTAAATVRCILDSLAAGLRPHRRRRPPRSPGATVDVIHVVGGGSQNELLCQLTADAAGLPGARRAGRGDRARQRPRPGPGPRRRSPPRSKRSARGSPPRPPPEVRTIVTVRCVDLRCERLVDPIGHRHARAPTHLAARGRGRRDRRRAARLPRGGGGPMGHRLGRRVAPTGDVQRATAALPRRPCAGGCGLDVGGRDRVVGVGDVRGRHRRSEPSGSPDDHR